MSGTNVLNFIVRTFSRTIDKLTKLKKRVFDLQECSMILNTWYDNRRAGMQNFLNGDYCRIFSSSSVRTFSVVRIFFGNLKDPDPKWHNSESLMLGLNGSRSNFQVFVYAYVRSMVCYDVRNSVNEVCTS